MGPDMMEIADRIRLMASDGIGGKRDLLPLYADGEAMKKLVAYLAEP